MSIQALHYITGDTPQSGFRRIGGSTGFPADSLPLLNNGEGIQERARVEAGGSRQGAGAGIQQLSHVWEYQTGRFGVPVVINTIAAIGTGRVHAFSEYVAGMTENAAAEADAGKLIQGSEAFSMLTLEKFMAIPGRQEVECPEEEEWKTDFPAGETAGLQGEQPDETWLMTLLSHYWKQASVRAFSENPATPVRVCLGEFDEDDILADTEETIRRAKGFFSGQIVPRLPRQVQNIASMAAGVHCTDRNAMYTALEFDIAQDMYPEETLQLRKTRELRKYRLNEGEMEFIRLAAAGKTPQAVQDFFDRYRKLTEQPEADVLQVPFMADYRVWYGLYCMERIGADRGFIMKAGIAGEEGNPNGKVRDARACFVLLQDMTRILENDHGIPRNQVTELLEPLETAVLRVMIADMKEDRAEHFLLHRNEMVEFHRKILYQASETELDALMTLAVLDQQKARAPQFVRCYPATPLRNEQADERNGRLLERLLPEVIRPLIDEEKKRGVIENKYLDQLRSEDFADRWACLPQNTKTREAMDSFLRQEIQDPQKHFLLYKISLKYLPGDELLRTTLKHFTENHARTDSRPDERQIKIAAYGAREYISAPNRVNGECVAEMNRYYAECFRNYRSSIGNISDIVEALGGDTSDTLRIIFGDGASGQRMTAEEAEAAFRTFGGEGNRYAKVKPEFSAMIRDQLKAALAGKDETVVEWIGDMISVTDQIFDLDTTDYLKNIFDAGAEGERMRPSDAAHAFRTMAKKAGSLDTTVQRSFSAMLSARRKEALEKADPEGFDWLCDMADNSPWRNRKEWIEEQHTENALMLCGISEKTGEPVSTQSLTALKGWLQEKSLQQRGASRLQKYCEDELKNDRTAAAEALSPCFGRIDEGCPLLRGKIFDGALEKYREGLRKPGVSFAALVTECREDTEKAGRKLDELYNGAQEETEDYLQRHFAETELNQLVREQEQIPENTVFARLWQERVNGQFQGEQTEMFNRQPNLERLLGLRQEMQQRNYGMNPELKAAYDLIDRYPQMLAELGEKTEYEAVTGMEGTLRSINDLLNQAGDVRKKLCSTLRGAHEDEEKRVREKSFRHALCAAMMRATLTGEERRLSGERRRGKGCPDWTQVLETLFGNRQEMDSAIRKPYAEANLGVLQKLRATVENVRIMAAYGLDESWAEDLVRTIHNDPSLHRYESALARNRKMSARYQLSFHEDGLMFNLKQI